MKKATKVDTTNENLEYWEKILESFGLGEKQLGLRNGQRQNITAQFAVIDDDEITYVDWPHADFICEDCGCGWCGGSVTSPCPKCGSTNFGGKR